MFVASFETYKGDETYSAASQAKHEGSIKNITATTQEEAKSCACMCTDTYPCLLHLM